MGNYTASDFSASHYELSFFSIWTLTALPQNHFHLEGGGGEISKLFISFGLLAGSISIGRRLTRQDAELMMEQQTEQKIIRRAQIMFSASKVYQSLFPIWYLYKLFSL